MNKDRLIEIKLPKCTMFLTEWEIQQLLKQDVDIWTESFMRGITIGKQEKGFFVDYRQIKHKGKNFRAVPVNMDYVNELGFDFKEMNGYEFQS